MPTAADAVERKQFVEVLIAPAVTRASARAMLAAKQNVRAARGAAAATAPTRCDFKRVGGGLLVQTAGHEERRRSPSCAWSPSGSPPRRRLADLLFAWRVAKFVKSNAIVFCADGMTLGVGAGQMSRVDCARIAAHQGRQRRA